MRTKHLLDLTLALLACLPLAACGDKDTKKEGGGEAEHAHKAPHGGEVLELGKEEGHLEILHDHIGGKMTVYVYGTAFDKPVEVARPTVTIQMKDGTAADVTLTAIDPKADGSAHGWKGEHAGLISDPWEGRIRVRIAGKDYQSPLEGPPGSHSHK